MARNKVLTFNEMCEMEARGDTCAELEEADRQMRSIAEKLAFVAPQFPEVSIVNRPAFTKMVEDFEKQNHRLSGIAGLAANNPKFANIVDQMENSSVYKLSKQLETLNLGASASIAKVTETLKLPGFCAVRGSLAELEKQTASHLLNLRDDYFSNGNPESLSARARQSVSALFTTPLVPENDFMPALQEFTSIRSEIAQATREQNEVMRNDFALLIEQMKAHAENSETLVNIAVATAEGNISSKKRNDRQFKITLVFSFVMTVGTIPAIVSGLAQLMPFFHRIQIVHWFHRLR
jgi:hypothetical protein